MLSENVAGHQADIDEMIDRAQVVARMAGDSRVSSQASQLASRYQTLTVNLKVSLMSNNYLVEFYILLYGPSYERLVLGLNQSSCHVYMYSPLP